MFKSSLRYYEHDEFYAVKEQEQTMSDKRNYIRASEVGQYVFCARAWRLRFDGYEPTSGGDAREAGERWHRKHGRSVKRSLLARRIAVYSSFLALVLAVFIFLLWWYR